MGNNITTGQIEKRYLKIMAFWGGGKEDMVHRFSILVILFCVSLIPRGFVFSEQTLQNNNNKQNSIAAVLDMDNSDIVATMGEITVTFDEFQQLLKIANKESIDAIYSGSSSFAAYQEYTRLISKAGQAELSRNVIDKLIRIKMINNEAKKMGISSTDFEINTYVYSKIGLDEKSMDPNELINYSSTVYDGIVRPDFIIWYYSFDLTEEKFKNGLIEKCVLSNKNDSEKQSTCRTDAYNDWFTKSWKNMEIQYSDSIKDEVGYPFDGNQVIFIDRTRY